MAVRRVVTNISTTRIADAMTFYGDVLEMSVVMDQGWIVTFAGSGSARHQISIASEGGSGTPVPNISIEVDNLEDVYRRMVAGAFSIEYGPTTEAWGVRRFYVRDPFGQLVNILSHETE